MGPRSGRFGALAAPFGFLLLLALAAGPSAGEITDSKSLPLRVQVDDMGSNLRKRDLAALPSSAHLASGGEGFDDCTPATLVLHRAFGLSPPPGEPPPDDGQRRLRARQRVQWFWDGTSWVKVADNPECTTTTRYLNPSTTKWLSPTTTRTRVRYSVAVLLTSTAVMPTSSYCLPYRAVAGDDTAPTCTAGTASYTICAVTVSQTALPQPGGEFCAREVATDDCWPAQDGGVAVVETEIVTRTTSVDTVTLTMTEALVTVTVCGGTSTSTDEQAGSTTSTSRRITPSSPAQSSATDTEALSSTDAFSTETGTSAIPTLTSSLVGVSTLPGETTEVVFPTSDYTSTATATGTAAESVDRNSTQTAWTSLVTETATATTELSSVSASTISSSQETTVSSLSGITSPVATLPASVSSGSTTSTGTANLSSMASTTSTRTANLSSMGSTTSAGTSVSTMSSSLSDTTTSSSSTSCTVTTSSSSSTTTSLTTTTPPPATLRVGIQPTSSVACATSGPTPLPAPFTGLPPIYVDQAISAPISCLLAAPEFGAVSVNVSLLGTDMLLDFPITLIYNPATPYTAGSLSLTSQGNATSNSSAAVAVNKVSLVATLPYTGLLPARLRKRQNLATNFSAVYVYAGGPTSLSQTPLLSQVSSLPGFLGSQRLPQLDQTPVGNVTWILTANEGAPWLLDISIDAGDYQSSFSTRLSFIISTGQPTYSGQGDLQALPWAMNSSIVDTAVFRASDFTAVWHVSRASNPSALCSSSFPVAATAEIFRVPLLVVENGTDFYKGEITSVDCSGNQPVHFKARVIFDDDPLLWRRRIAVTVALPEQKLNVIQDVVDEIDIRSGVLKYSSFNQTFSMNATTLVPAVLPTTNSTALQSASLIYHALAIRNVSLATDTWLYNMTFFTPLQVRPLDPAFALSNIMTAIANSEGVNVPILPLSILHNFTFHYVPAALSVKGNVSYGSISGMLDMRFAMPAIGSNAIEDKHVFFHEPSAVNRKLGNMSITLQSHPCDSSVDEHATTFDLSNIPAAQLLVATGQYTADNSSIHVPEPMFDPTVLKSADQGASTRFRCSSGAVQSISTTGPLQSNRTSVSLLGNKVTYHNPRMSYDSASSYVRLNLTIAAAGAAGAGNASLALNLPMSQEDLVRPFAPTHPLWAVTGLDNATHINTTAYAILGNASAHSFLTNLYSVRSTLFGHLAAAGTPIGGLAQGQVGLAPPQSIAVTNITYGYFQQFNESSGVHAQIFTYGHGAPDLLTNQSVYWQFHAKKVDNVTVIRPNATSNWTTTQVIGTSQATPSSQPTTQLTSSQPTPSHSSIATQTGLSTTPGPTYTPKVPVTGFAFGYNFSSNAGATIDLSFQSGYDVCSALQQQVTLTGTGLPGIGNLTAAGRTIFTCDASRTFVTSFYSKIVLESLPFTAFGTDLNLSDVSLALSCLPHSSTCAIPSGSVGSTAFSWANSLNISQWSNVTGGNFSDYINNPPGTNRSLISVAPNLAAMLPVAQQMPSFIVQNQLAYAMLNSSDGKFSLPTPTFMCPSNFTQLCASPGVALAGTLQFGSFNLSYGVDIDWDGKNGAAEITSQTFAAQIGDYGVILATLNGSSVCDSNLQLTAQFTNLPFGLANIDPVAGSLSFECGNGTALSAYYLSLDLPSIEVSLPVISSTSIFIPSPVVQFDTGTGLFAVEWPLQNSENPLSQPLKYGVGFLVSDVLQTFNLSVAPSSPGNVTLISLWTSAPTPLKSFFEAFMATEFQSFAADAYLNPFSFQMDTSSHLVSLQVGMQSTRSGAVVTGDFTIQVAYNASASPMFSVASETLTVELDFQGGGYVRLVQQYLACSMNASNAAQPGSSGFGNFSLTLEGIGLLAGTCYVVFECGHDDVTSWINTTYFNGTVTGPINISVLGVQIEVDSVSISYSTDSGVLNATAAFNTTNVALSYILPTPSNGLSSSHMASLSLMETAQAVSPFGSDFPFSTAWVDVLGSANVEILAKDMLVSNLSISYTCDAPGVANASETLYLAGNVDFEPVDLSLAVNMTKPIRPNSSWIVDDASLSFAVGSYMLINVQGDSPCAAPNQTVNVELSQVGPISALQGSGLILFSCDANNSIVDYSFEISVPAFEMSAFGETESLMGSFAFNKSNDLLLVTAASATDSWTVTANVTVHNSTLWAFAYTLGNATDFSSLPFGAGVGNAFSAASASLSSLSNGLMANVMATYSNYPGLFTFFGDFDSQIGSFALGSSLYVTMNRSSPGANWVISTQLDLAGAITIGDYGKIGFNSTLACPNGAANIVAIFNGIPGIPSIDASGTVTYECAPTNSSRKRSLPNIQNYNASVSLDSMVISLFGEQVEISNVTVSYQSASKVLNISGTAVMSGSTLDAGIMVSASFDLSGPSAVLSMLQMDVAVGTTALFGGNLPFSGFLGGSLDQSGQSLISPTADLGELVVVYQNGPGLPPNMTIQASINDGSLAGKLFMLLENGPASINNGTQKANASSVTKWFPVFGTVLVDLGAYGTLELNGTSPCPLGTTGGSITLVGDLELPAIGQQTITGEVDFTCNSTGSIIGYVAKLSDTFNLSLSSINNAWCEVQGTLVYDSVGNTFELSASAPDSSAIVLSLTVQGNQDYTVAFFVNSSANFSDLPFANGLGSIIDGPGITQNGPLSTLELLVADFEFRHPNSSGFNETLIFSAALEDQFGLGSSGSANASFVFTKANTSSPWHVVEADLVLALSISDVLTVTLDFNATCPGAFGSATARFSSLPLQIAPFSIGGTVEFQCVGNTVNYTNYTIVLGGQSFGNSLGIDFTFFGESIDIPFPTIVIPSWPQPQVNFNWNWTHPNWTIPFSLAIGPLPGSKSSSQASSPAPPGASVQKGFNWPFKLGFSLAGSVTVADVIDMVASFFTPFGSVGGDIAGFLSGLASNAQAFFNTFGALSFSDLFVSMDPVTGLQFSGQISIFGYVTDFWFLATQQQTACSSGSWTLFYGVKLFDGTPGTFNSAEFPWLNSLFGANSSLSFQDVVFGVATGCGSYNIGDFSFSAPSPGILIAGDILFEGPMTSIVGNTGSFGNQLDSKAGTSDSLDFVIEISPESLSLIIDLESNMTASTSQSFMDISLQLVVDFTKYELSFYFNFEYSRVLGTDAILFDGALGISIMPDAVTLDGLFMMVAKNGWNNPFGLCSNLTIYSLGLSMQFDPEVMLPVSFGMEFNATLGNVFAQGQLLISAATPEAGNAVQLAMGNLFLGDIVYTFLDFIPSWMQNTLNQISLQYVDFSFNPSVSPAQFSASQPVIPPGLFLNVTNLDFLNIVTVESAIISQQGETLMADLQLAPMNFGSVISVTSATVSGGGPSGGLIIGPSNCRISFDGQASLFGSTYSAAGYFHTDPETGASTAAINVTWTDSFNDTVEVSLVESTGGYSSSSWSFALTFTLTSTYQGGFFAGVVASYVAWLNEELGYIAGNITSAVNSQADSMKASAQQVYEAAVATANLAEVDADAALQSAQDSVNNLQSQVPSCSSESSDCSNAHWYSKAYYCAIYAGCEVGAAAMQGTLWVAEQTLSLAESAVNDAVAAFDDAMSAANTALQDAISAAQDLVDSVMSAVQWAINSLASGLSTAIGDFINLVYLQISDTLSSSAQETFAGTATFGCFGSAPQTYSITFSINSVLTTLETITENCAEGLTHWVAAQLEGTKAAQFFSSMV